MWGEVNSLKDDTAAPKVSVLIPVYNRQDYIGECIQSALEQTFSDIEIIIVDNSSTDRTWEICQEYRARDSRIRIFRNEENMGPVFNWKKCIDLAAGKFGKVLFSDDLLHPECIERMLHPMEAEDIAFVYSSVELIGLEASKLLYYRKRSGKYSYQSFFWSSFFDIGPPTTPVSPCAALFRLKDMKHGLLTDIPSSFNDFSRHGAGPDLLLFYFALLNYPAYYYIAEPLVKFRYHDKAITVSSKDIINDRYIQAKLWFAKEYLPLWMGRAYLVFEWFRHLKDKGFVNFSEFKEKYES
ncbi:glycosyltransferase family 2 protein [Candidatus Parcubacteria bacterium]|nr:MAG: glycosyltransferase family 2 protein [Candidatus Parcubacteria bacterium]